MNEKLKMFLRYPNAEIKENDSEYKNIFHKIYHVAFVDGQNIHDFPTEDIFNDYYLDNCKLQLHSMEDMTEEDRNAYKGFKLHFTDSVGNCFLFETARSIDFCRENNYDIDGLIAKGWAERIER